MLDPWGNAPQHLPFDEDMPSEDKRQDTGEDPVNNDYDLYSKGKDGETAISLTSATGMDDIVRADNGRYAGLAEDY
ncbi:MAG TPA: hypothetical protein DCM64_05040 [Gammaproteobacteria bacterium]|nr:hypothetical protein [Gammaproteobacteria bacterium]MDP6734093.1 hypothetical protein [Gammaproteobacteria bacterium]HAJ75799.1 hypothetical protein [Gammaproteobacteria bacterium]